MWSYEEDCVLVFCRQGCISNQALCSGARLPGGANPKGLSDAGTSEN